MDLNHRPLAYEASELPLLYPAVVVEGIRIETATWEQYKPSTTFYSYQLLLSEKQRIGLEPMTCS